MGNFINEDGFIQKLNEKLVNDKAIIIQTNIPIEHILQIINILYLTKVQFFKSEVHLKEGVYYHYQISIIE